MKKVEERDKYKKIFTYFLFFNFIVSVFVNNYFFPQRFNTVIFLMLIPLVFTYDILILRRYLYLVIYILMNLMVLLFYITDLPSVINLLSLIIGIIFFACLAYRISSHFNINEIIDIFEKNFILIFIVSIVLTTFLTLINSPFNLQYFLWETLFSEARLQFLSTGTIGHTSANFILPVLFSLAQYNLFTKEKKLLSFILLIFFGFLCILTKSRTTFFLLLIISLSSFAYSNIILFKKYFHIFIISIGLLFLSLSLKPIYVLRDYESKIFNFVQNIDIYRSEEMKLANPERFFAARDILNQRLFTEIKENPFFGIGHGRDLFLYGVDKQQNIALSLPKVAGGESVLIIAAKYGVLYFFALILFMVSIPFLFKKFKQSDRILFQNLWSIIFIHSLTTGGFASMYGMSGNYFLILCILYFKAKSKNLYS